MKDSGLSSIDKERIKIINNINKLLFKQVIIHFPTIQKKYEKRKRNCLILE